METPCYAVEFSFRIRTGPSHWTSRSIHHHQAHLLRAGRPLSQYLLATRCSRRRTATTTSPCRRLSILLGVDLLDDLLDLLRLQVADLVSGRHDRDLDVFGASLHDFEQGFDGQLDGAGAVEGVGVVALEEFADGFRGAADSVCFPVSGESLVSWKCSVGWFVVWSRQDRTYHAL